MSAALCVCNNYTMNSIKHYFSPHTHFKYQTALKYICKYMLKISLYKNINSYEKFYKYNGQAIKYIQAMI
jgi:hypothetical protein